ncbi:hypothetical protein P8452_46492 [Trifolium repens]|nr:hypothetical protein P8452_46492 [Trifolium repens]
MGDQLATRADLGRLTATLNALTAQYKIFINQLNNNKSKTYISKAYIKVMSDQMTTLTIQIIDAINNNNTSNTNNNNTNNNIDANNNNNNANNFNNNKSDSRTNEVEHIHDATRDFQYHEVVNSEGGDTKSAMVSNTTNPKVQSALSIETCAP